ncbi:hypothetical protein HD806DRAFT_358758 [Xylariaceae sp. AK1471]|nr:hypothetical protein HD806DRAFT_358758 [Xylariaceae sp. AK1471]
MWHPLRGLSFLLKGRQDDNNEEIHTEPQDSVNGSFVFPVTYPLTFRETSTINITWKTSYEAVNLYYYQSGKVATSLQISTNLGIKWFQWQVHAEETNLTLPYVFRIVNARGTDYEQTQEGFWSTSFYITRDSSSASTTSMMSSTLSTSSSSSSVAPSFTSLTTTSTQTPTASNNPPVNSSSNEGLSSGAIAGIAVGASLGAIALAVVAFWFGRRKTGSGSQRVEPGAAFTPSEHPKSPDPRDIRTSAAPFQYHNSVPEVQAVRTYHEMPHG